MLKKLCVLLFFFVLIFSPISHAGPVEELVHGNWGVDYTDYVKHKWNPENCIIQKVYQFDPLGKSKILVKAKLALEDDKSQPFTDAILIIEYNPQRKQYLMTMRRYHFINLETGNVKILDQDREIHFAKVYFN